MCKTSFLYTCKKTISPIYIHHYLINRVRPTVTCNTHIKFELNRMHRLYAVVFTHIHTLTHAYHRKNIINEFRRPQNVMYVKISRLNVFIMTILSLHSKCSESKNLLKKREYESIWSTNLIRNEHFINSTCATNLLHKSECYRREKFWVNSWKVKFWNLNKRNCILQHLYQITKRNYLWLSNNLLYELH